MVKLINKANLLVMMRLTRFEHSIIGGVGVFAGAIITTRLDQVSLNIGRVFIGVLVTILLIAGCFALNDYADVEVDRINQRFDRPLVTGEISERFVLISSTFMLTIGMLAAILLGLMPFTIAGVWLIFGILYDFKLKEWGFIGNLYIATSYAAPWFYGSLLFYSRSTAVLVAVGSLSLIAFIAGLGREILKGIMDIKGDPLRNVKTVALTYGTQKAAYIAAILIFGAIALTPLPLLYSFEGSWSYLILVSITNILLIKSCLALLKNQSYETAKKTRNNTLIAFIIGALAFLGGALGP